MLTLTTDLLQFHNFFMRFKFHVIKGNLSNGLYEFRCSKILCFYKKELEVYKLFIIQVKKQSNFYNFNFYEGWLLYFGIREQKQILIIENRFIVFENVPH